MRSTQTLPRTAGVLFIIATAASLLSVALLNPIVNSSDYLVRILANQDRVTTGALFEVVAGFASAGIAISLYPVLRGHNEGLALGAVGFRIIEGTTYVVGAIGTLLLLSLSQELSRSNPPTSPFIHTTGALLKTLRDRASLAGVMSFYVGALMYYCVFYRSRLIPRWLSGWGVLGVSLGMVASRLVLYDVVGSMSTTQVVLNLPIGINELVLAVWLIVKGFGPSTEPSGSTHTVRVAASPSTSVP